jgi:hypothetical protein
MLDVAVSGTHSEVDVRGEGWEPLRMAGCLTEPSRGADPRRLKVNSCGFTISACSLISEQSINQLSMSRVLPFPLHVPCSGKP